MLFRSGASRIAITKYLKSELNYENASALKAALKKAVSSGTLEQSGQSFRVKGDKVTQLPPDDNPLIIKDIKEGKGEEAKAGDTVTVKYVGTLDDGHQFYTANNFDFVLGGRQLEVQNSGQTRVARVFPISVPFGLMRNLQAHPQGLARPHAIRRKRHQLSAYLVGHDHVAGGLGRQI